MKNKGNILSNTVVCVCLLASVICLVCFSVMYSLQATDIERLQLDLATSRQRENKQNYEYDRAMAEKPIAVMELELTAPKAKYYREQVEQLKAQRKELRRKVKEYTAAQNEK